MGHFLWLLMLMTAMETSTVYSQQTVFRARAIASYNAHGTMIRAYKRADPQEVSRCGRFILVGRLVSIEYDDGREIRSFSLKARNGEDRKANK